MVSAYIPLQFPNPQFPISFPKVLNVVPNFLLDGVGGRNHWHSTKLENLHLSLRTVATTVYEMFWTCLTSNMKMIWVPMLPFGMKAMAFPIAPKMILLQIVHLYLFIAIIRLTILNFFLSKQSLVWICLDRGMD